MSVAALMLVKDEADIIGLTVAHLLKHVDEVLVIDNGSTDGTREILERLPVELVAVEADGYRQAERTNMLVGVARARGHGWVLPCDADEMWIPVPPRRTVRAVLRRLPAAVQVVGVGSLDHLPTAADDPTETNPFVRLGWRSVRPPWPKVAARVTADVEFTSGAHSTTVAKRGGVGLALHHFPVRSLEHFQAKAAKFIGAYNADLAAGVADENPIGKEYDYVRRLRGQEALDSIFYDRHWSADPANDPTLVYDPVKL